MCGIAGFLGAHSPLLLQELAAALSHRGPDGEGLWHDSQAGIGLAHRRLAIIDPTDAASQPMQSCNGRYRVVFNGEIYNFRLLAAELTARGYVFNQHSDTAVLGPLYDLYGPDMLRRLNGIFAFAIWDCVKRQLFIARDALGVKPLYYARTPEGILFASEFKALLRLGELDRTLDPRALNDYLVHLWSPGARTLFRTVSKLPPGHALFASAGKFAIEEWYRAPLSRNPVSSSRALDLVRELSHLIDRVVADQCISDVPIGAFLSGGIDSSGIVAAMAATGHRPARTYCIGFEGNNMVEEGFGDDLTYARLVAHELSVPLTPIVVKEAQASDIEALAWTLDEPQADPAALYVGAIAAAARQDGIKVLMSGAGADDVFSGYRRHNAAVLRAQLGPLARPLAPLLRTMPLPRTGALRRRLDKLRHMLAEDDETFLMRGFEFNRPEDVHACLAPAARSGRSEANKNRLETAMESSRGAHLLDRMLYMELHGFLPDHNLNYTDKGAMAHGVEVRVPFLDERMVAFAGRLPWHLKVHRGRAKWLLKQALAARLPRAVLTRTKTGFGAPVRRWIAGPMRPLVMDIIGSRSFRERGLFDVGAIEKLVSDVTAGRREGAYLVLALVMTELWLRRFCDCRPATWPRHADDLAKSQGRGAVTPSVA
jgi:asparagine synthase (glutamine-hydrolysing)